MELRDSGRDLVQIKDDGTHVILPASAHRMVRSNRVGLPVIVLRHSDGKMRRGGSWAASRQRQCPVDERGRLHGAPGLAVVVAAHQLRIRGPCL